MKIKFITLILLIASNAGAQDVFVNKTQSQCESEIANASYGTRDEKKNKEVCKNYPQSVINCASDLAKTRMLTYTFDSALADCNRFRPSEASGQ